MVEEVWTGFCGQSDSLKIWNSNKSNNNILFKNKHTNYTLILAVDTTGFKYWQILSKPLKRKDFLSFLKDMINFRENINKEKSICSSIILMDNLSSHKGKEVQEVLFKANLDILFNCPYSPDYNYIEIIFSRVRHFYNRNLITKDKMSTKEIVNDAVEQITWETIISSYKHSLNLIYNDIRKKFT